MTELSLDLLRKLWSHGNQHVPGLLEGMATNSAAVFAKYGIDSDAILAMFMGQWQEECGAGIEMWENLNYSAMGLVRTWPSRFSLASAQNYAHNPHRIADKVYNGRMGNRPNSDDGWNFRGRGLPQLTGRENYAMAEELSGLPLLEQPDLVCDPEHALLIGVLDLTHISKDNEGRTCLDAAKAGDFLLMTKILNGGTIGYADRVHCWRLWQRALRIN